MRRTAVRLFAVAVLIVSALGVGTAWEIFRFEAKGPLNANATVIVPQGSGLSDIAHLLAKNGIVSSALTFEAGVKIFGGEWPLKAGEYAISANASPRDVMDLLQSGRTVLRKLTIAEGLTAAQVAQELRAAWGLMGEVPQMPGEGRILPETYRYTYGDSRAEMVSRMTKAMDEQLATLWAHRVPNLPLKNPQEALILASIVEKETGRPEERPHVASVFLNRLEKGMRLQSDPTVVFSLTMGAGPLGRPLTHADLETPSPYNTYQIDGLPPGPIDNPGREAILAVTHPDQTDDLYFVADGNGGHAFAHTLEDHNRNVGKLRKAQARRENEEAHRDNEAPKISPSAGSGASPVP